MAQNISNYARTFSAILLSAFCCAAADSSCTEFVGRYVLGEPEGQQHGLVLQFDSRNPDTGDTVFSGFAEVQQEDDGRYQVYVKHREADTQSPSLSGKKWLVFKPMGTEKSEDAVLRLMICRKSARPILIRVEGVKGKQVIFLEPLP